MPTFLLSGAFRLLIGGLVVAALTWFGGNGIKNLFRDAAAAKTEKLEREADKIVFDAQIAKKDALILRLQADAKRQEESTKAFRDRAYKQIVGLERRIKDESDVAIWAADRYQPND